MIAFFQQLPLVQWNGNQDIPLSDLWVHESILQAAELAGYYDWQPAREVARAIVYYLREDYPENVITARAMNAVMFRSLEGIGKLDIARHIQLLPPRVNIYLPELARQAAYPLVFFNLLKEQLNETLHSMVRGIRLEGLRKCVKILENRQRWQGDCQRLSEEIVHFSRCYLQTEEELGVELVICA